MQVERVDTGTVYACRLTLYQYLRKLVDHARVAAPQILDGGDVFVVMPVFANHQPDEMFVPGVRSFFIVSAIAPCWR